MLKDMGVKKGPSLKVQKWQSRVMAEKLDEDWGKEEESESDDGGIAGGMSEGDGLTDEQRLASQLDADWGDDQEDGQVNFISPLVRTISFLMMNFFLKYGYLRNNKRSN